MKTKLRFLLLATLLISTYLYDSSLKAQEITSFEIYPPNPSSSDEVRLIVGTSFFMQGCTLDSVVIYYACGAFALDGFYNTAFDPGACERTDTISLGMIANGGYALTYRMYYLGWTEVDKIDTSLTVGTTGLRHRELSENTIRIWPNPSNGNVNIEILENEVDAIRISNMSGSYLKEVQLENDEKNLLNILSLSPGMYICTASRNHKPVHTTKFIVLE